ncbi:MAG TPA: hypothetical protein VFR11_04515 [Micromonosporaceae bacterium]|jgi:hypothetical protein|nr:hypothetical protein [Micromonosporaceae bacterium]
MSVTSLSLGVLQRVSDFLAELPEDQLIDLAEGRARLAFVPEGGTEPAPRPRAAKRAPRSAPSPSEDTLALVRRLESLTSREHAAAEVGGVSTAELRAAARALSIPRSGALRVADLRREVVDATVGRRLDSIATRGFEGARP